MSIISITGRLDKTGLATVFKEVKKRLTANKTASALTMETSTDTTSKLKTYTFKQGNTTIGTIDIPADLVVTSGRTAKGSVASDGTFTESDSGETYIVLTIANQTAPVCVLASDLVKDVAAGTGIDVDTTTSVGKNTISVKYGTEAGTAFSGSDGKALQDIISKAFAKASVSESRIGLEVGVANTCTVSYAFTFNGAAAALDAGTLTYQTGSSALVMSAADIAGKSGGTVSRSITPTAHGQMGRASLTNLVYNGVSIDSVYSSYLVAYNRIYWGFSSSESITTKAEVTALSDSKVASSPKGTVTATATDGQYFYICVPASMTVNSITSDGFGVALNDPTTITASTMSTDEDYKVYRAYANVQAGNVSYVVA